MLFSQTILITLFALLIAFGAFGNSLVCFVVVRNPAMRTPRNIFIINLAISDLTFCLFTQPFNLLKVLMPTWRLGRFMCKFVPMCSGANVFVSTISITAIALDRFQVGKPSMTAVPASCSKIMQTIAIFCFLVLQTNLFLCLHLLGGSVFHKLLIRLIIYDQTRT